MKLYFITLKAISTLMSSIATIKGIGKPIIKTINGNISKANSFLFILSLLSLFASHIKKVLSNQIISIQKHLIRYLY